MQNQLYPNDINLVNPFCLRQSLRKSFLFFYSLVNLFSLLFFSFPLKAAPPSPIVAVIQAVKHPALDAMRQGISEGLAQEVFASNKNLVWLYDNAQGNIALSLQIAQKYVRSQANVIVTLGTPTTQTAIAATQGPFYPHCFCLCHRPTGSRSACSPRPQPI